MLGPIDGIDPFRFDDRYAAGLALSSDIARCVSINSNSFTQVRSDYVTEYNQGHFPFVLPCLRLLLSEGERAGIDRSNLRHAHGFQRGHPGSGEEVPYDLVHDLRMAWHFEHPYGEDPAPLHAQAREVALRRGVRILAVKDRGRPVAFAQLEHEDGSAEITQVYVHRDHRGRGLGAALTRATIEAQPASDEKRKPNGCAKAGYPSAVRPFVVADRQD